MQESYKSSCSSEGERRILRGDTGFGEFSRDPTENLTNEELDIICRLFVIHYDRRMKSL